MEYLRPFVIVTGMTDRQPPDSPAAARAETLRQALTAAFPEIPAALADQFAQVVCDGPEGQPVVHRLDKPYGRNLILAISGDYGLSCARLLPGRTTSYHRHATRREFFAVREGRLHLRDGDDRRILRCGDWGASTPGVAHQLANAGNADCEFVEVFSPPLLEDKFRIDDPYSRPVGQVGLHE